MATVPGTPDNVIGIHPAFQPTQADLLQAAAIMHGQGKFQTGMQVEPLETKEDQPESQAEAQRLRQKKRR